MEWITIQYNLCLSRFAFSNLLVCVQFVRCVAYSFWLLVFCFVLFFVCVVGFWCLGFDIYGRRPIGNWMWTSAADFFLNWIKLNCIAFFCVMYNIIHYKIIFSIICKIWIQYNNTIQLHWIGLNFFDCLDFFWLNWDELKWITYGIKLNYVDLDGLVDVQYNTPHCNTLELKSHWIGINYNAI